MKLSDFLSDVGRPVAFYPSLVKALGDRNEAIFICQMAYWRGKGDDKDGWIYKTSDEIEGETSLTYKEQANVRRGLVEHGLLEERYARTEHLMYYRVNWDAVNAKWEQFTDGHMPAGKVPPSQRAGTTLPKGSSLNSNTETTHKNTSKETFLEFEKLKAQHQEKGWAGREQFRDDHLLYADWWYSLSGQPAKGNKPQVRSCQKAFSDWQNQALDIASLQQSYDARLTWKKFIADPNELTKDAAAIQAMPKTITTTGPAINDKAIEATRELLKQKEGNYVPMPEHLRRRAQQAITKVSDVMGNMFPEKATK